MCSNYCMIFKWEWVWVFYYPPFFKECLSHFHHHCRPYVNIIWPIYNTSLYFILFPVRVIYRQAPNAFEGIVYWHQYTTCLRFSSNMKMVRIFLIAGIHIIFVVINLYYILVYSSNDYIADLVSMILFAFRDSTLVVSDFVLADFFTTGHMHLLYFRGRKLLSG